MNCNDWGHSHMLSWNKNECEKVIKSGGGKETEDTLIAPKTVTTVTIYVCDDNKRQ